MRDSRLLAHLRGCCCGDCTQEQEARRRTIASPPVAASPEGLRSRADFLPDEPFVPTPTMTRLLWAAQNDAASATSVPTAEVYAREPARSDPAVVPPLCEYRSGDLGIGAPSLQQTLAALGPNLRGAGPLFGYGNPDGSFVVVSPLQRFDTNDELAGTTLTSPAWHDSGRLVLRERPGSPGEQDVAYKARDFVAFVIPRGGLGPCTAAVFSSPAVPNYGELRPWDSGAIVDPEYSDPRPMADGLTVSATGGGASETISYAVWAGDTDPGTHAYPYAYGWLVTRLEVQGNPPLPSITYRVLDKAAKPASFGQRVNFTWDAACNIYYRYQGSDWVNWATGTGAPSLAACATTTLRNPAANVTAEFYFGDGSPFGQGYTQFLFSKYPGAGVLGPGEFMRAAGQTYTLGEAHTLTRAVTVGARLTDGQHLVAGLGPWSTQAAYSFALGGEVASADPGSGGGLIFGSDPDPYGGGKQDTVSVTIGPQYRLAQPPFSETQPLAFMGSGSVVWSEEYPLSITASGGTLSGDAADLMQSASAFKVDLRGRVTWAAPPGATLRITFPPPSPGAGPALLAASLVLRGLRGLSLSPTWTLANFGVSETARARQYRTAFEVVGPNAPREIVLAAGPQGGSVTLLQASLVSGVAAQ